MDLGSTALAPVLKPALTKLLGETYALATDPIKKKLRSWTTDRTMRDLYRKSRLLRSVKTVWQFERELDLYDFYYQSRVLLDRDDEAGQVIGDLADFPTKENFLVVGAVGQGKSVFLRYLASQELLLGRRIPALVELRRVRAGDTLIGHAMEAVRALGLLLDAEVFDFLARNGKVVLLLDALDEAPEECRRDLIARIDSLAVTHNQMQVIVSSRPDSGLEHSPRVRVVRLAPLRAGEYADVIVRLHHNAAEAHKIAAGVEMYPHVAALLTTPLMVSLLLFRYRADQTLPQNIAAFYENLFDLLVVRHDRSKPGFVRRRASNLGDIQLQTVFEALCFETRRQDLTFFSYRELVECVATCLARLGFVGDAQACADDIIKVTCLILREGSECQFVHKSVQEFHAAAYVRGRTEEVAAKVYTHFRARWAAWRQELAFLQDIDSHRYTKYFVLPDACQALRVASISEALALSSAEAAQRICAGDLVVAAPKDLLGYWSHTESWTKVGLALVRILGHTSVDEVRAFTAARISSDDPRASPVEQKFLPKRARCDLRDA